MYLYPTFRTDPWYFHSLHASCKVGDRDLPDISKPQTFKLGLLLELSIWPNEYTSCMDGENVQVEQSRLFKVTIMLPRYISIWTHLGLPYLNHSTRSKAPTPPLYILSKVWLFYDFIYAFEKNERIKFHMHRLIFVTQKKLQWI